MWDTSWDNRWGSFVGGKRVGYFEELKNLNYIFTKRFWIVSHIGFVSGGRGGEGVLNIQYFPRNNIQQLAEDRLEINTVKHLYYTF